MKHGKACERCETETEIQNKDVSQGAKNWNGFLKDLHAAEDVNYFDDLTEIDELVEEGGDLLDISSMKFLRQT